MADAWSRQGRPSPFLEIEAALDRALVELAQSPTPNARALANEAERLRSVVAGWRMRPPHHEELREVTDRVQMLVGAAAPTRYSSRPPTSWEEGETTVWNPDDGDDGDEGDGPATRQRPGAYQEPPTNPRRGPKETKVFGTRLPQSTPPPAEAVVVARPIVIEAEPMETTDPSRPMAKPGALEGVKDAVLVDDNAPEPRAPEPMETAAPRPLVIGEGGVRVAPFSAQPPFDKRLTLLADPYSDRADAYRSLARKLAAQGKRVIAVTSAEEQEGKSTCAANLALALREGTRGRVLLLEANLRSPALAMMFGFTPPECFDDQLRARRSAPNRPWTVVEQHPPLHVLAVDRTKQHAPMFDPGAFSAAIASLNAAGYDQIVLDTPPVLGGAAVNVVADHVDGVVLAVTARRTMRRALKRAADQLSPAPILGVVLIEGA